MSAAYELARSLALALPAVISTAVDCHGPPMSIQMVIGSPTALQAVDAYGVRTTFVEGAPLLAFLQYPDGSQQATGSALLSVGGLWQFTHETDPLAIATSLNLPEIIFFANLTAWRDELPLGSDSGNGVTSDNTTSASCCYLSVPQASQFDPGETIQNLFVPPLRIARLVAHNTGRQGGFGTGDSIEVTFATRTNRAGLAVGELLSRYTLDQVLIFDKEIAGGGEPNSYAATWRDDCTLLVVVNNVTAAPTPITGAFGLRIRDDIYELRDHRHLLQMASVARSPVLEGTFGAAQGRMGRTDPLRSVMPDLAARRFVPPKHYNLEQLRHGPQAWHPIPLPTDVPEGPRNSECDAMYLEPDMRPPWLPKPADALPTYQVKDETLVLIERLLHMMNQPPPPLTPFRLPPYGMPERPEHIPPPSYAPWTPSDQAQQDIQRTQPTEKSAAAAVGPNGFVQQYPLTLTEEEFGDTIGLEDDGLDDHLWW